MAGSWTAYGVPGFVSSPTSAGQTTLDNSAGTTLQADTVGPAFTVGATSLIYKQTVVFDTASNTIKISADIYNNTASIISGVVYARGMDPDMDIGSGGGFATFNSFLAANKVMAVGPSTGMYVIMSDLSGSGVASIAGSATVSSLCGKPTPISCWQAVWLAAPPRATRLITPSIWPGILAIFPLLPQWKLI